MFNNTFVTGLEIFAFYIVFSAGCWYFYGKANIKKWPAFIPVLNIYYLFKMVWAKKFFWIFIISLFIALISASYNFVFLNTVDASMQPVMLKMLAAIALPATVILCVTMYVILCRRITNSFKLSTGWTVALVLLFPAIFLVISLGWPKYHGNAYLGEVDKD